MVVVFVRSALLLADRRRLGAHGEDSAAPLSVRADLLDIWCPPSRQRGWKREGGCLSSFRRPNIIRRRVSYSRNTYILYI